MVNYIGINLIFFKPVYTFGSVFRRLIFSVHQSLLIFCSENVPDLPEQFIWNFRMAKALTKIINIFGLCFLDLFVKDLYYHLFLYVYVWPIKIIGRKGEPQG